MNAGRTRIRVFLVVFLFFPVRGFAAADPVFRITAADIPFVAAGFAVFTGGLAADTFLPYPVWNGQKNDITSVNPVDRYFSRPYSKPPDVMATTLVWILGAAPFALTQLPDAGWKEVSVLYLETLLYSQGLKEGLKACIHRYRPYTYYGDPDTGTVTPGDYVKSWPSGHVTTAFAGAVFSAYVYCAYYPDSEYRQAVVASCLLSASAVGVLRMMSGSHFLTDVLGGALLGSSVGFLVPFLHKVGSEKGHRTEPVRLLLYPSGAGLRVSF